MSRHIDLTGQKFGNWTVIKDSQQRRKGARLWLCECKCGFVDNIISSRLKGKSLKLCLSCIQYKRNLIGKVFEKWTVFKKDTLKTGHDTWWMCLCTCGTIRSVSQYSLTHNKSTQCRSCSKSKAVGDLTGSYFIAIKKDAQYRNIIFNVSIKELWNVFLKQKHKCGLSGVELKFAKKAKDRKHSQTASVDRIDNAGIYELQNIWFIHKTLNMMKGSININTFLQFCQLITYPQHNNNSNLAIYPQYKQGWAGYGNISNSLWMSYKDSYQYRTKQLVCTMTIEDMWDKFIEQKGYCALTGLPLVFYTKREQRLYNKIRTASLDRIDSNEGYTKNNTQWIHKTVNKMKWDIPQTEFINWCQLITQYNKGKNV